ncbi:MAG: type II toxin-antitoxin system death-on-curing family toxin [Acidobacteriota bacterium]
MIEWIDRDVALAYHNLQIAEHGGAAGVRDIGLLESALARPRNLHAYEPDADLASLAAAYAFGIIQNHPFVDGNKRTGYVLTESFIILNGCELRADAADKYVTIIALADGSLSEDELAQWLRERITPSA